MEPGNFGTKTEKETPAQNLREKNTKDTVEDNTEEKILKQASHPKRNVEGGKRISRKQPIDEVSFENDVERAANRYDPATHRNNQQRSSNAALLPAISPVAPQSSVVEGFQ